MAGLRRKQQIPTEGGTIAREFLTVPPLDVILAVAICVVAFGVRVYDISEPSIWADEAASWSQSGLGLLDLLRATSRDNYPPLHNIVLHYWTWVFGDSEAALRLPSAIFGTLNILAIYWLGRLLGYRKAGVLAAALLAFSGFHIWYSQETRPYALLSLCATLFVTAVLLSLRTGKASWYVASAVTALALLYTHPYGFLLWVSVAVVVTVYAAISFEPTRMHCLKLIAWQLLPAIGFLPWAIFLFRRAQALAKNDSWWIPSPTPSSVLRLVLQLANGELMLAIMVPAILAALFWPSRPVSSPSSLRSEEFPALDRAILFAWLIGPLALGLVASLISQPVLWPRYVICSLPAIIILAAIGFSHLMTNRTLTAATFVFVSVCAMISMITQPQDVRPNWRETAANLSKSFQTSDCLAMYEGYQLYPFSYYFRPLRNPIPCFIGLRQVSDLDPAAIRSSRLWLILEGSGNPQISQDAQDITRRFAQAGWRSTPVQQKGVIVLAFDRGKS